MTSNQRRIRYKKRKQRQKRLRRIVLLGVMIILVLTFCGIHARISANMAASAADYSENAQGSGADTEQKSAAAQDAKQDGNQESEKDTKTKQIKRQQERNADMAESKEENELLILVNPWNTLPDDFEEPELVTVYGSYQVDVRCYEVLMSMLNACEEAGYTPVICSAYRSHQRQQELYEERAAQWMAEGYSKTEAYKKAGTSVAIPGTSEHELGLAVDLVDESYQMLDEEQENTGAQQWLLKHSWEYGWVLRYPTDKSDITGIIYEPWHYRYVGKTAAKEMHEADMCLEEYISVIAD